jgi:hypothetical protein
MKIVAASNGKKRIKISKKEWQKIGQVNGWIDVEKNKNQNKLHQSILQSIIDIFGIEEYSREAVLNAIDQNVDRFAYEISEKINSIPEYIEEGKRMNGKV